MRCAVPGPCLEGSTGQNNGSASSRRRGTDDQTVVGHSAMAKRGQALRTARAVKKPAKPAVDLKQQIAALKRDLRERTAELGRREVALCQSEEELREALEQQTAVGDVLKVISRSTFDLQAVLETLVRTAARLCNTEMAFIMRRDGDVFRAGAAVGFAPDYVGFLASHPLHVDRGSMTGRVAIERRTVHVLDVAANPEYRLRESVTLAGQRTALGVPLLRDGDVIGVIVLARQRVEPFTEPQIGLVRTFADQAVIAIENTRLLTEQREALEQQTATAEVLEVINSSPGDLAPVFDAMLEKATLVCSADAGVLATYDGTCFWPVALRGFGEFPRDPIHPHPETGIGRLARGEDIVHILDSAAGAAYRTGDPGRRAIVDLGGARSQLCAALRKEGKLLGALTLWRREVRPFTEKQIALLQNFAAQAVIAMENARLITETREALEQQTATAEVLQVINSSPGNLAPVFEAVLDKALHVCEAAFGTLFRYDGKAMHLAANRGMSGEAAEWFHTWVPDASSAMDEMVRGAAFVHIADVADTDAYRSGVVSRLKLVEATGARTALWVALRKEDALLGVIVIYRREVRPFSDKQIALLQNFAGQAVIAMENARLITETREALERQTATAEVLGVINSSPGHLTPVFDAVLDKAIGLCDAAFGMLTRFDGECFQAVALHGVPPGFAEFWSQPRRSTPGLAHYRLTRGENVVQVGDITVDDLYISGNQFRRALGDLGGARTVLWVALRKDDALLGSFVIYRQEVCPFTDKQIALVQNFAAQAVIAMENARLITETREALEQQTATAEVLQVINSSPGDLAPVFDAMLGKAMRLCEAAFGVLWTYDGEQMHVASQRGVPTVFAEFLARGPHPVGSKNAQARMMRGDPVVHIIDVSDDEAFRTGDPVRRALVELGGGRTMLAVPLRKDKTFLGSFVIYRQEVKPFSDKQIALLQNFAAQAVIAMENARLITETREALEQQTATADVLRIINSTPGELGPVFHAILEKAHTLCAVAHGSLQLYRDGKFRAVATQGLPEPLERSLRQGYSPGPNHPARRLLEGERFSQTVDWGKIDDPIARVVESSGIRTTLYIPLRKDQALLGYFSAARREVRSFTDKEAALLESFAAQAVIAMENARLLGELRESLEQQRAIAEILQAINRSPGDLQPVFDILLDKAMQLCRAAFGVLGTFDGESFRTAAMRGVPPAYAHYRTHSPPIYGPGTGPMRVLGGERVVHVLDLVETDAYRSGEPNRRALVDLGGARTSLHVALVKDQTLLGTIQIYRQEVRPFSDNQIALLQNFAEQAVIAMENARLLGELRTRNDDLSEALEFQTATGEVLRIVAGSPDNLRPVFDAMLERAIALCGAKFGILFLRDEKAFSAVADRNLPPAYAEAVRGRSFSAEANTAFRHLLERKSPVHIRDMFADAAYAAREPLRTVAVELGGVRSVLAVPLLKKGELIGSFAIYRDEPGGFAVNQVALVTTFADQAVIAMENARLFDELRARTTELARSVDELTATSDVLKIISRSSVDLETVLTTLAETAARLCHADQAHMFRRRDDRYHLVATFGGSDELRDYMLHNPFESGRGATASRAVSEGKIVHIPDVFADPEYTYSDGQKLGGFRTTIAVPLLREGSLVGVYTLARYRVEPFTEKEIELLRTFADQAVIAIENARLFEELRERQAELRVTFDNMGDGVAMFDGQQRLVAWNSNFQQILDMPDALLARSLTYADYLRILAERGEFGAEDVEAELNRRLQDTERELQLERTRPDGRVIEVRRNAVPGGGFVLIYADITERKRAEEAIRAARDAAESALRELQAAQASLLHAQKMAALGQLTAGIAHEIKNPLNFVNNFAGLSVELLDELKEAGAQAMGALDPNKRAEFVETIGMLTGNLEKIAEHGRRADGIVKSMLAHSRGGSGDWRATDLNVLVEEALNLAYHGARAQDQSFNITMERDLDRNLAPIEVVPQEVTRVLLNLIGNGFYAASKRSREGDGTFRPVLTVTTRDVGDAVEIRVRDNGVGIAAEHREKLFQPFFTTKPTGEGTGLGLSISYEIVTQQHGGTITIDSEVGQFTEFTVRLPRRQYPGAGGTA
jgi:PAS domain S-box-containing protein